MGDFLGKNMKSGVVVGEKRKDTRNFNIYMNIRGTIREGSTSEGITRARWQENRRYENVHSDEENHCFGLDVVLRGGGAFPSFSTFSPPYTLSHLSVVT